ncbi:MAG TPA: PD-(D/E)XK nuclease-like domain-containing protein [Acidobacteriaceae bacterium]|jgi:hypothetical protein
MSLIAGSIHAVQANGLYDMDISVYHSQKACVGPSVSSSSLRTILHQCPAVFWAHSDLNPHRCEPEDKKSLAFGRAAHTLVLGEPEFDKYFIVSPFDDFRSKEAREWRDAQDRQIVKAEELAIIQDMAAAQKSNAQVMNAFTQGKPEQSLIWKDAETGVWLKARPDWLPNKPAERFITEYKTAESIKPAKLSRAVFDYGYEMQAAIGLDGVETVLGVKPLGMAHVVQEKKPPYLVDCRLFTAEQIAWGRMQYRKALRIFADCLKTSEWPGYTTEPTFFDTPFYIQKAMENFTDAPGRGYDPSIDYSPTF